MRVDDWYEDIDEALGETVDAMFDRLRKAEVVSLDHYRKVMKEYKSWKPLPMKEYRDKLWMTKIEFECREARRAENKRILPSFKAGDK